MPVASLLDGWEPRPGWGEEEKSHSSLAALRTYWIAKQTDLQYSGRVARGDRRMWTNTRRGHMAEAAGDVGASGRVFQGWQGV